MTMEKSQTIKVLTGCSNLYVTISEGDSNKIFFSSGKSGGCSYTFLESLARMATLVLEKGGTLEEITSQLKGLRCPSPCIIGNGKETLSCSDGISKAIETYIESKKEETVAT